ncbi:OB-fold-containig protein [Phytomonospora endophytica]|uniref:DUF1449 family protein n=1 Tax=Phytomonospora endophytica TaxID=714109 RepID=A0A841G027_9ACTN|nr:OB-fold-containig protein [Phytomonospora endophytica]MBB6039308.1 hypothetical protein [Phytomonospora endophytica]GIG69750.1 hypothetical protein Pen01_60450 [Phytomonospora endophytica]
MREFVQASLGFPAVVFTFALIAVIGFWVLTLFGGADPDFLDTDGGAEAASGEGGGFFAFFGLGDVPATVVLSLLITFTWFASLAGTVLLNALDIPTPLVVLIGVAVLLVAVVLAWVLTRALIAPLRRVFRPEVPASRNDFVGRVCVIRTGSVTHDFGQAEVAADDGSTAIVQVRVPEEIAHDPEDFRSGRTALIFDYDETGEVFLVAPPP